MSELSKLLDNRAGYKARWMPIYFEPVDMSGERFTVGIAAIGENDYRVEVIQTMRPDVIKALFGVQSKQFISIVSTSLSTVKAYAEKHKAIDGWKSAISGVSQGEVIITRGQDMRSILNQGITLCSSMARLLESPEDQEQEQEDSNERRWDLCVKDLIIRMNPDFETAFNRKITVNGRTGKYGIVTNRYIANFGALNPKQTYSVNAIGAKLMSLENLYLDKFTESDLEMVIAVNEPNDKHAKDAIANVVSDAEVRNIPLQVLKDEKEVASHLFKKMAA